MNTKHTPGPWTAGDTYVTALNKYGTNRFACSLEGGYAVDSVGYDRKYKERTSDEELKANARLIAAAPELLAALRAAVTAADSHTDEGSGPLTYFNGWNVAEARTLIADAEAA